MDRPLDYLVPDGLVDQATVGSLVRVRFSGNRVDGWIIERTRREVSDGVGRLEAVVSATPVLTPSLYEAARRVASRFLATTSQVLSLALPPRHARAEKDVLASAPGAWPLVDSPAAGEGWRAYSAGQALLSRLAAGESPRAIVTSLHPHLRSCLSEAVAATVSSGRSVIVITATGEQATRVAHDLEQDLAVPAVVSGGEVSAEERYRVHVAASLGRVPVVVGTRSAAWVPCASLGLIIILDDGDDRLRERRFPRCDALDVAVQRCAVEGAGLLVLSASRSVKAQALVRYGWAVSVDPTVHALREATPRVHLYGQVEAQREGAGGHMRIPQAALRMIRQGLRDGPVLIQVASAGYWPTVVCRRCEEHARCPRCFGPLTMSADEALSCAWCGREPSSWRCPHCSGRELRGARVGSSRTAEEIARTLPEASVLEPIASVARFRLAPPSSLRRRAPNPTSTAATPVRSFSMPQPSPGGRSCGPPRRLRGAGFAPSRSCARAARASSSGRFLRLWARCWFVGHPPTTRSDFSTSVRPSAFSQRARWLPWTGPLRRCARSLTRPCARAVHSS